MAFLKSEKLGTLSTVTEEGKPDGAAIYYVVKNDWEIHFLTKKNTGKYKNILQNEDVVLTVTNLETQETVKIRGKAVPISNPATIVMDIITALAHSKGMVLNLDKVVPIIKRDGGEIVAVKIIPEEIRMSVYILEAMEEETFVV